MGSARFVGWVEGDRDGGVWLGYLRLTSGFVIRRIGVQGSDVDVSELIGDFILRRGER